jgi:hypothetical protein
MEQKKEIADKLHRIRQLWIEQKRLEEGSPEHDALLEKIRVLSAEYQALSEKPQGS